MQSPPNIEKGRAFVRGVVAYSGNSFQNFVGFGRALLSRQSFAVFRVPRIETLQGLTYYPILMGGRASNVFEFTGVRQNYCEKWQPRTPLNQLPIRVARVLYSLE